MWGQALPRSFEPAVYHPMLERSFDVSFGCQGFLNFTEPCHGILPQPVVVGCVHEHVRKLRLCSIHRQWKNWCKVCLDFDGHRCVLTLRETVDKS